MNGTTHFHLNDREVKTDAPPGRLVLDFLRCDEGACGTKEGCKEGDCGACAVLVGELDGDRVSYQPVTSCLLPLGEVAGMHVVTIEGLNMAHLSPVQSSIVREGGTQCGFCTPGIVVSVTGLLMDESKAVDLDGVKYALSGHLCRCTGYRSLKACESTLREVIDSAGGDGDRIGALSAAGVIPEYFTAIPGRLARLREEFSDAPERKSNEDGAEPAPCLIAGGTDLYVQQGESIPDSPVVILAREKGLKGIAVEGGRICIGALTTFEEFATHPEIGKLIPDMRSYNRLFASWQIRNRATLAGNVVNASPIGDMTALLLALETDLVFRGSGPGATRRVVAMKSFYLGYKRMDMLPGEVLVELNFPIPADGTQIHFEKVSKRTCLDIATVNSAARVASRNGVIDDIQLTLGGVAPVPLFLRRTCDFLNGKPLDLETVMAGIAVSQGEISPISDVRGSAEYKRLLARQLVIAHFTRLFPTEFSVRDFYEAY